MGNQFTASRKCRWLLLLEKSRRTKPVAAMSYQRARRTNLPNDEMKSQKTAKTGCCQVAK